MNGPGWLTRWHADVPMGEAWLGPRERQVVAGLTVPKRRDDWLLGRWTAKVAVAMWCGTAPEQVEIQAAADGVPEAHIDGRPAPLSLSLSHRAGRALVLVADLPTTVGCDLEILEPRSDAFVREWLSPAEQDLAYAAREDSARTVNLIWTAKEAAAKMRREGLRLDVRGSVVDPGPLKAQPGAWNALRVSWDGLAIAGWWRAEPGWVMAVAADPGSPEPEALAR